MPENRNEKPKAKAGKDQNGGIIGFDVFFPKHFVEMQARNVATLARASEIMIKTAQEVWQNETKLFELETAQARGNLEPIKPGDGLNDVFANLCGRWHDNTERAIGHMRTINDLVRDCEWQLLDLVAENVKSVRAQAQSQ